MRNLQLLAFLFCTLADLRSLPAAPLPTCEKATSARAVKMLREIWAERGPGLTAALATAGPGGGTPLYNAQVFTGNLLKATAAWKDLELLDELAEYLLAGFENLTTVDDYQTWVDEEGEEIGTLHRSQFLYEVAEALRIFAALAPWERTPAMEELFTLAPVLLHDHYWRWVFGEASFDLHPWGCDGAEPLHPKEAFTLGAWVRTTASNGWIAGVANTRYLLDLDGGRVRARVVTDQPNGEVAYTVHDVTGVSGINDGLWHHVALRFDSVAGSLEVWVDGVLDAQRATTGLLHAAGKRFHAGGYHWGAGECCYFEGRLDEIHLYRRALAPSELVELSLCNSPSGCPQEGIVAQWTFELDGHEEHGNHHFETLSGATVASDLPWGAHAFLGSARVFDGISDLAATHNWYGPQNHQWSLRGKAWGSLKDSETDRDTCHALLDVDLWIVAGIVELLAAYEYEPALGWIAPDTQVALVGHVQFALQLIESRLVPTRLRDFDGQAVQGLLLDPGLWGDHTDYAYCGYTAGEFPSELDSEVAPGVGWDISHARRWVHVFETLHRHRWLTEFSFPTQATLEGLANQFVYGSFNGDFDFPLFANYMDGSDGWYRVGFQGPGSGYAPGDLSAAAIQGGFGFWMRHNADIEPLMESLWGLLESRESRVVKHREAHFGAYWSGGLRVGGLDVDFDTSLDLLMFLPVFVPSCE